MDIGPADAGAAEAAPPLPPEASLPWEQRKELGTFKAYWKTVFVVFASLGNLSKAAPGPLTLSAAKAFRRRTILFVLMLDAIAGLITLTVHVERGLSVEATLLALVILPFVLMASALILGLSTGAVTWFMASRKADEQSQEKALATGYYTCAAMLLQLLPMVITLAVFTSQHGDLSNLPRRLSTPLVTKALGTLVLVFWYVLALRAVYTAVGRSVRRTVLAGLLLPVAWLAIPVVIGVLPAAAVMWVAMIASLS